MSQKLQGVFPVLPTPFNKNGDIAFGDIEKIVDFAVSGGADGIVANDFFSEVQYLCDEERREIAETVLTKVKGRVPVIVGVSSVAPNRMVEFALHAQQKGASAVLCSVPYLKPYTWQKIVQKGFQPMNDALKIPIIIQNSPEMNAGMGVGQQKELLTSLQQVQYVKEDSVSIHMGLNETHEMAKTLPEGTLKGLFAGEAGYDLVAEYHCGVTGFMPGMHVTEYVQKVWEALLVNDFEKAERIQFSLGRLRLHERLYPGDTCKYMLKARGIIENTGSRCIGKALFDEINVRELERILVSLDAKTV